MKCRSLAAILTFALTLLLVQAGGAFAAVNLSIAPSGANKFVVNASPLDGVAGLDFTISYDSNLLANPVVEKGGLAGSAMLVANPSIAGSLRIALINATALKGSGPVAVITFTAKGTGNANLTFTSSNLIDQTGKSLPVTTGGVSASVVANPTAGGGEVAKTDDAATGSSSGGGSTGGSPGSSTSGGLSASSGTGGSTSGQTTYLGGVTMTTDTTTQPAAAEQARKDEQAIPKVEPVQEQPIPPREAVTSSPAAESKPAAEEPSVAAAPQSTMTTYKSVLNKVRDYKGDKTTKAMQDLFQPEGSASYRQEPAIVLSDGAANVKARITVPATAKNAPNFALKGARLVSLRRDGDTAWVVEAKPEKGTFVATITMLQDGSISEIPLVVAPPTDIAVVKPGVKPTEAEFMQFLKERGTDKAPRYDLNKDGKRDYIDDYIFTANYLFQQKTQAGAKPVKK